MDRRPLAGQSIVTNSMVCRPGVHLAPTRRCMRSSESPATVRFLPYTGTCFESHRFADIAVVGKKVVDFYKIRGGEVVSPLVRAL